MQNQNDSKKQRESSKYITRLYIVLSLVAVVIMIIAAYITHGYQAKKIFVSFDNVAEKIQNKKNKNDTNNMRIGADLSDVPSDKVIEDILNDVMPSTCKDCDENPLDCLKEYEINKILVQDKKYQNYLIIELLTGKETKQVFRVVVDLSNNNQVVSVEGSIDKKRCRDIVEENPDNGDEVFLQKGDDPESSHYIKVTPK